MVVGHDTKLTYVFLVTNLWLHIDEVWVRYVLCMSLCERNELYVKAGYG